MPTRSPVTGHFFANHRATHMTDESIQKQLDWYQAQIKEKRNLLDQKRQEFFQLDAEVSRLEREANRLFRIMFNEIAQSSGKG